MNLNIPPEIVNKHRLLTEDEISIYNLRLYMHMPVDTDSNYTRQPLIDEKLGVPYYIDTNANIANANELNNNYIFYKKDYKKDNQICFHFLFNINQKTQTHMVSLEENQRKEKLKNQKKIKQIKNKFINYLCKL